MAKGEKREGDRNRKFHYLEKEKSFLGEIKSILRNYLWVSFGETMKNCRHNLWPRVLSISFMTPSIFALLFLRMCECYI